MHTNREHAVYETALLALLAAPPGSLAGNPLPFQTAVEAIAVVGPAYHPSHESWPKSGIDCGDGIIEWFLDSGTPNLEYVIYEIDGEPVAVDALTPTAGSNSADLIPYVLLESQWFRLSGPEPELSEVSAAMLMYEIGVRHGALGREAYTYCLEEGGMPILPTNETAVGIASKQ